MSTKLSFSFGKAKPKTATPVAKPSPLNLAKPAAFESGDDDEELNGEASSSTRTNVHQKLQSTSTAGGSLSRAAKKKLQQEVLVDPTVYEYDEVYDRMKEAELRAKAIKEDEAAVRKVCTWVYFLPRKPRILNTYSRLILIMNSRNTLDHS